MHTTARAVNRVTNQELRHRPIANQQSIARSVKPAFYAQHERTDWMRFVITTLTRRGIGVYGTWGDREIQIESAVWLEVMELSIEWLS